MKKSTVLMKYLKKKSAGTHYAAKTKYFNCNRILLLRLTNQPSSWEESGIDGEGSNIVIVS